MEIIFVNDIPIRLTNDVQVLGTQEQYDACLDRDLSGVQQAVGNLLIKANPVGVEHLLRSLQKEKPPQLQGITVLVQDEQRIQKLIQQRFKLIKAAGGVVNKGSQLLMIHRRGKWEFPKGKLEKGEESAVAAIREVEEECNIKVKLLTKICSTWHTYVHRGPGMLKKTTWYAMACLEDAHMRPQVEEGIDQVAWMGAKEVQEALRSSYRATKYVFQAYQNHPTLSP